MLAESSFSLPALQSDLYERFLQYADVAPSSLNTYRRALRQLQLYLSENSISAPTRNSMLDYKRFLLANKKPTTAQSYLSAAKVFFSWLEIEGIYPNVCRGVKSVHISNTFKKDYLTPDMIRMVLDSIPSETLIGRRDRAVIALMAACGLRCCEVARARVGDLRPRAGLTVLYLLGKGETDRSQYCIVPPSVEKLIREYLSGRDLLCDDAPLFASTSNQNRRAPISTRTVSALVKQRLAESGFSSDRLSAHSLRHSAITIALITGSDLHEVQGFARHASIATTTIYAHELEAHESRVSAAIAETIF